MLRQTVGGTMRNAFNYGLAVLLMLATIPLYRVILGARTVAPSAEPAPAVILPASLPPQPSPAFLLAGEQCIGGTVVYVVGRAYTQALAPNGQPVRCAGRVLLR